ncbi:MAG: hypothetical protein WDN28_13955 [Chthoniobacter sp.]
MNVPRGMFSARRRKQHARARALPISNCIDAAQDDGLADRSHPGPAPLPRTEQRRDLGLHLLDLVEAELGVGDDEDFAGLGVLVDARDAAFPSSCSPLP